MFFSLFGCFNCAPIFDPQLPILRIYGNGVISSADITTNTAYKSIETLYIRGEIIGLSDFALSSLESIKETYIESTKFVSIGKSVFKGCEKLEKVVFPDTLKSFSHSLFSGCSSLTHISFSSSLTSFAPYCFYDCSSLKEIYLPNALTSIPEYCFYKCSSLQSVNLSVNIEILEQYSFAYCSSIKSISIHSNIKHIRQYCFQFCSSLSRVELSDGLVSISTHGFTHCTSLFNLTLPKTVTEVGINFLRYTNSLLFINVNQESEAFINDNQGILYSHNLSVLLQAPGGIKEATIPSSVTEIREASFNDCVYLQKVAIPDNVVHIGKEAFWYCIALSSLSMGQGVKELPIDVFYTSKLKTFDTGNGLEVIPLNSLRYVTGIENIIIGANVKSIDTGAFSSGITIKNIIINDQNQNFETKNLILYSLENGQRNDIILISKLASALEITVKMNNINFTIIRNSNISILTVEEGHSKYSDYHNIVYNNLNDTVIAIPGGLRDVDFHPGTIKIGQEAGHRCNILTAVFHEGLTRLEKSCLRYAEKLESLEFPSTLQYVGELALQYCSSLRTVVFHSRTLTLGNDMFYDDINLNSVSFNEDCDLQSIPQYCFYNCPITTINIPKNCKLFGMYSFKFSGIKNVIMLDSSLNYIDFQSFYNSNLTEFIVPKRVQSILESTFQNSPLTSISFEEGSVLEIISSKAFANTLIDSVSFPPSIKNLTENSFLDCINLVSVTFPEENNLTGIQQYCFANCRRLSSIDLGVKSQIKTFLPALFEKCYALKTIRIPDSVEHIRSQAFYSCIRLNTIKISLESELTEIGERAFDGCLSLEEIRIPPKVQRICTSAFNENSALLYLNFTDDSNCVEIQTNAFLGCTSLTEVSFPSSIESIGAKAFETCGNLVQIKFASDCKLRLIAENTFFGCSSLQSLEIPVSVEGIEKGAFNSCRGLRSIQFAEGSLLEIIDDSAFFGCSNLKTVEFGANSHLRDVNSSAFSGCRNLESIVFPQSLERIGSRAFETCERLKQITLPDDCNLSLIADGAFTDCISLESIRIPFKVHTIERGSFDGCTSLSVVSFAPGSKLTTISKFIFGGCIALEQIIFDNSEETLLKTVETDGFNGCTKLSILVLPGSVEEIQSYAFRGCASLTSVQFHGTPNLREISSFIFSGCTSLISFNPPDSVLIIKSNGFSECDNIKEITFSANSNLQTIEPESFSGCQNLTRVVLPVALTQILPGAFFNSHNLTNIIISGSNPNYLSNGTTIFDRSLKELIALPSASGNIEIDANIDSIFSRAFEGLPITNINLDKVRRIGDSAFEGCPIESINLSSARSFGNRSFANCNLLVIKEFGEIEYVGDFAFRGTKRIPSFIKFSNNLTYLGEGLFEGLSDDFSKKTFVYCGNSEFSKASFASSVNIHSYQTKMTVPNFKVLVKLEYPFDRFGGILVTRSLNSACEFETAAYMLVDSSSIHQISITSFIADE